jgi:putative phosphoribosyl transferase
LGMFRDRKDAGQKLGEALDCYKRCDGIVLAIPRGGVEVGYYVAEHLELPLSIIVVRKLPLPTNPEAGFGAIAEDGSVFFVSRFYESLPRAVSGRIIREQKQEIQRRIEALREGKPLPPITGKTVILVDDGIAMGSTMRVAVALCRSRKVRQIVVAAPVAGPAMAAEFARIADQVVILEKPPFFRAVAEAYENWYDVPDEEVIGLMRKTRGQDM